MINRYCTHAILISTLQDGDKIRLGRQRNNISDEHPEAEKFSVLRQVLFVIRKKVVEVGID